MPFVERDGARLHYAYSPGRHERAVLLQHPLCSDPECYSDTSLQQRFEEAGYHVVRPASIGHGQSSSPRDPTRYGLKARALDQIAVLDDLGLERVAYVGYSMGTWLGCGLLAHHSERLIGASLGGFDPARGAHSCGIPLAITRSTFGRLLLALYALWPKSRVDARTYDVHALQRCFTALYEPMPPIELLARADLPLHFWSTQRDLYTRPMRRVADALDAPFDLLDGHHFSASSDERFVEPIFAHIERCWDAL